MTTPHATLVRSARPTWIFVLDSLDEWPETLPCGRAHFGMLLVMDGRDVAKDDFRAWNTFARRAADQGMAYFSTWGPDCGRLHDIMDECEVGWEVIDENPLPYTLMTTWHYDEDLGEALWFVHHAAVNLECQGGDEPCLVVLVGRPELEAEVVRILERIDDPLE